MLLEKVFQFAGVRLPDFDAVINRRRDHVPVVYLGESLSRRQMMEVKYLPIPHRPATYGQTGTSFVAETGKFHLRHKADSPHLFEVILLPRSQR